MIQLRLREWGEEEWCYIFLQGGREDLALHILGSPLQTCSLHVQLLSEEGEWEDFE